MVSEKVESEIMKPGLIISLDFELNWGYNNPKLPLDQFEIEKTLNDIKALFDKYNIRTTWATVGRLLDNLPKHRQPRQPDNANRQGNWISENLLCDKNVDFGSHSFEHIFFKESSEEQLEIDFESFAQQAAGLDMESIVFPRNQYDSKTLELTEQYLFQSFRTVQNKQLLRSDKITGESKILKLSKRFTELIPLNRDVEVIRKNGIIGISDSRFFRFFPQSPTGNLITLYYRMILRRELKSTLKRGKLYHIWFHPHNLIVRPYRLIELEAFLFYFQELQRSMDVVSYNMKDIKDIRW